MKKFLDRVFLILEAVCNFMMAVQVLVTAFVVAGRYLFNKTPVWGEQLTLLMLIWLGMLSAAITVKENSHIRVTFIDAVLPAGAVRYFDMFSDIVLMAFCFMLFYAGTVLTGQTTGIAVSSLGLTKAWFYVAVPISCVFMLVGVVLNFIELLHGEGQGRRESI